MADSRKIVRIFLASPGDLQEERQAAKSVVDEFNKLWADRLGIHVELVGWEDTVSRFGRPQELINRDLERCEAFVGLMWRRWGMPPSHDGPYTSGFEEEFELSAKSRRDSGRPEISLFFKSVDPDLLKDPGEDLRKVLAFQTRIVDGKEILFEKFSDMREFEARIRGCITNYVLRLVDEAQEILSGAQVRPSEPANEPVTASDSYKLFSTEGARFIRELIAKSEKDRGKHPITSVEIARFRLLGSMISVSGNDERSLGVHDANILFNKRGELSLSRREMQGLIDSGLDHFASEAVPLWYWYTAAEASETGYLVLMAWVGHSTQRIGSLGAMRLISEPIVVATEFNRDEIVRSWFSSSSSDSLKVAALDYLAVCGIDSDLQVIREEFERRNYQTGGAAINAIIRLNLKQSREAAIRALYELQPESIDEALVENLFARPDAIETSLLFDGAVHRSPAVRKMVVPILVTRRALAADVAERLLTDTEAAVRYEALMSLVADGREFSDETLKGILIKPTGRRGGFGFGTAIPDKAGEAHWERFSKEKLRRMSDGALERLIETETILNRDATFALDFKHFNKRGDKLRNAIDDEFKMEFSAGVKELEQKFGESEAVTKVKSIEEYLRKEFCRKALDILCEKGALKDLGRLRQALQREFVEHSDLDIGYLQKHGEWQDIPILITLAERPDPSAGLLWSSLYDDNKMRPIAAAMLSIGKGRFAELVALTLPDQLLARVIARAADKEFLALSDDDLHRLFMSTSDQVRKATALKAIKAIPKSRLKRLLERYSARDGYRYYNVIHWLDMGVSLPKARVVPAALRVISKQWRP